jgi:ketosteroid isomerase-like protein
MSKKNAEMVRALIERWNAGNHDFRAIAELFDPAIELESPFSSVVGEPYRGHGGIERWILDVDEQFAEWRIGLDDLREVGEQVIAIGAVQGRGRASGVAVQFTVAMVAQFGRDDRITRVRIYPEVEEALKAVGLSEDASATSS